MGVGGGREKGGRGGERGVRQWGGGRTSVGITQLEQNSAPSGRSIVWPAIPLAALSAPGSLRTNAPAPLSILRARRGPRAEGAVCSL